MVVSSRNSFRVLFGKKCFSVYFIWKRYRYFSSGNSKPREPAPCQLCRHTFVPSILSQNQAARQATPSADTPRSDTPRSTKSILYSSLWRDKRSRYKMLNINKPTSGLRNLALGSIATAICPCYVYSTGCPVLGPRLNKSTVQKVSSTCAPSYGELWTGFLFCSSAVLDPRVGHAMDVLSPFISVLCHSDWLFRGESCPRLNVYPGRAWSSSLACTWHCSYDYLTTMPKLRSTYGRIIHRTSHEERSATS